MNKQSPKNISRLKKSVRTALLLLITIPFLTVIVLLYQGYYSASKPISYLPGKAKNLFETDSIKTGRVEFSNSFFILTAEENGKVAINTTDGELILSGLAFFSSYEDSSEKIGFERVTVRSINDTTVSIYGNIQNGTYVTILMVIPVNEPRLDVQVTSVYSRRTVVLREALVADFAVPVTEIYLKNRQLCSDVLSPEYWLQRQGARFGAGTRSALIYHTPMVSSLQLDAEGSKLFINLDYALDHPHLYFPYQENGEGRWEDRSVSVYEKNDQRSNFFSMHFGANPSAIPRIMMFPSGFLGGYVFTEHADETDLRTHRAVYFGHEDILDIENATGGFAGHRVPVTKSVFYVDSTGPAVKDDQKFLDFLDQLHKTGQYDICLHTPEFYDSNHKILEESIQFMKERYGSATWIDHGFESGKFNRESFVCDGLDKASEYYVADLWEKYNTRYFWNIVIEKRENAYIEKVNGMKFYENIDERWRSFFSPKELKQMGFVVSSFELLKRHFSSNSEMNSLHPVKGDTYPTPLYYQHPTHTSKFYSWVTDYVSQYGSLSDNDVEMYLQSLRKMINEWGIFINHGYYPRRRPVYDVLSESGGKIVIDSSFDRILEKMALLRDEGDLYLTTIQDLLDYWILTENVQFKYLPEGVIHVCNNNSKPVKGFSLAVKASEVKVNGIIPNLRQVGEDTIFWFDIPANDYVILTIGDFQII